MAKYRITISWDDEHPGESRVSFRPSVPDNEGYEFLSAAAEHLLRVAKEQRALGHKPGYSLKQAS